MIDRIRKQVATIFGRLKGLRKASGKPEDKTVSDGAPSKRQEIIVAIIVCALLAAAIAGGVLLYSNQKDSKPATAAGKQDARGYTLTPPAGWKQVKPTPQGTSVAFTAPASDTDVTGTLPAFVVVQSAALNKQALQASFEDIAKTYVTQLAQGYTDYQVVSTGYKTIASIPALFLTFTSTSGKTAVTTESLFTVKDGISYTVNGGTLTSAWPQHSAEIEQSLLTFRP